MKIKIYIYTYIHTYIKLDHNINILVDKFWERIKTIK